MDENQRERAEEKAEDIIGNMTCDDLSVLVEAGLSSLTMDEALDAIVRWLSDSGDWVEDELIARLADRREEP